MTKTFTRLLAVLFLNLAICTGCVDSASAQCSTAGAPTYTSGCSVEYFTSLGATGGVSTISVSGISSCSGTYFNDFASEGITAPAGTAININMTRITGYTAYLSVYADWNNDGTYETTELAGSVVVLSTSTPSATYPFTIPTVGVVTGTNLHMRVFLSELSTGAPCTGNYGQTYDFYIHVGCPAPVISVLSSSASICPGSSALLTASGAGAGGTYSWSPATGLSATTGTVVTASPSVTTVYTVSGTNATGCTGSTTETVTVNPIPTITVSPSSASFCGGAAGVAVAASGAGAGGTYTWSPSSGLSASTGATVTATPVTTSVYTVTGTSAAGCSSSASTTITVTPLPVITVTATGPASICPGGDSITLMANGAGVGGTYTWSPPAGLSATTGASVTGAPSVTTVYTVTGATATGCGDTATATIMVNPPPSVVVTVSGSLTVCEGSSMVLSVPAAAGNTYQWYNGTAAIAGATGSAFTDTGAGNLKVIVTNSSGCSDTSASYPVIVNPAPIVSITVTGDSTFCAGDSVKLATPLVAGYTYQWYDSTAAIAGATSATYYAKTSGSYYCLVTVTAGVCPSITRHVLVTEHPLPVPVITFNGKTFKTATNYTSYQWYENSVIITGATHDSTIAHSDGMYSVKVTDSNGCTATSTIYHLANLAVTNVANTGIGIYPNPATNTIYIQSPVTVNAVITGMEGKVILEEKAARSLNISLLPAGIYLVVLFDQSGQRLLIQKLVKVN